MTSDTLLFIIYMIGISLCACRTIKVIIYFIMFCTKYEFGVRASVL